MGTALLSPPGSLVFGLSPVQALVILFVVLPVVLGAVIVPLVGWRTSKGPRPVLTSDILATGQPARGEILEVRSLGTILDVKPMVRFRLRVSEPAGEPFDLTVVQALPRSLVGRFRRGDVVELRVTADRSAGAIVVGGQGGP